MPNFKVSYENKLKAVLEYLNENTTQTDIAKKNNVSVASFQIWIRKYKSEGEDGLKPSATYKKYNKETKYSAVLDYLNGVASQEEICKKYRISSKTQLQRRFVLGISRPKTTILAHSVVKSPRNPSGFSRTFA